MTPYEGDAQRSQDLERRLQDNLGRVLDRAAGAAARAGRELGEIRLVAVTKTVSLRIIRILSELGQIDFGENRPEEIPTRAESLRESGLSARWHMIGHFQRRKIAKTLGDIDLVHSAHSEKLLAALDGARAIIRTGPTGGAKLPVLLQVNVSGEPAKQGLSPEDVRPVLDSASEEWPQLEIRGLMTMAPIDWGGDRVRELFARLRRLRDDLSTDEMALPDLSMGMSQDFEEAILEGSTLIRVGSALYEGVNAG